MKLVTALMGQAIRLGKVSGPAGGSVYGLNLSRACEERYGFLQAPRMLPEYDLAKGVTFLHGYFQGRVVIDKFQVFENGLLAEAQADTDECDAFLEDVIAWVGERGGMKFEQEPSATRLYLSQIEVQSDLRLPSSFSKVSAIGKQIAEALRGYGQATPDFELTGLSFGSGPGDAASFKFERRDGANVPRDLFFASSRLRTADLFQLLQSLEPVIVNSVS